MKKRKLKQKIKELEEKVALLHEQVSSLELEVFGGFDIEFEPDPELETAIWLSGDPNESVRESILQEVNIGADGKVKSLEREFEMGHSAAEGGEIGPNFKVKVDYEPAGTYILDTSKYYEGIEIYKQEKKKDE